MAAKKTQTFYVSKFALTKGILKLDGEVRGDGKFLFWDKTANLEEGFAENTVRINQFHTDLLSAQGAAEKVVVKRLNSLNDKKIRLNKKAEEIAALNFDSYTEIV